MVPYRHNSAVAIRKTLEGSINILLHFLPIFQSKDIQFKIVIPYLLVERNPSEGSKPSEGYA